MDLKTPQMMAAKNLEWLVQSATDPMLITDTAGIIVMANAPAHDIFGYTSNSLVGTPVDKLLPERFRTAHNLQRSSYMEQPSARKMGGGRELFGRRVDGSEFPVEVSLSQLAMQSGVTLIMATVHDITLRRQAAAALQESESRLRVMFDTAVDAIITIDDHGCIETCNPAAEQMFGYSAADMKSRNISALMPSPYRERHDGYLAHYLQTGQKKIIGIGREVLGLRSNGMVFPMELAVAEMQVGTRRMFTGIVRDISARKQAEAKFRSLVEQIDAVTYIAAPGPTRKLLYVSPQISRLGFSADEWITDPELHARQMHPDDRDGALQAAERSRATGAPLQREYRLLTRDGCPLWFREEAKTIMDDTGHVLFVQGLMIDVTQSKLSEQALQRSEAELRQLAGHLESIKESERKRIAQEIHDELGGLFTGIKAYASVYLERAARSGTPVDPLLNEVTLMADSGLQAVRRVIADLRPSVLDQLGIWAALEWHTSQIERQSELRCTCTIDTALVQIDPPPDISTMVFRIVQEALTNVVRHANASHACVNARLEGDMLIVEVRDDGVGLAGKHSSSDVSFGIAGMNERARYFGGELMITSSPGNGTEVHLRLPMKKQ